MKPVTDNDVRPSRRNASGVRVLESGDGLEQAERRAFLQALRSHGITLSATCLLTGTGAFAADAATPTGPTSERPTPNLAVGHIVRDFADAYVELIRLLREASEVEHALMAQYLYGAFSLKPAYASIAGYGSPNSNDLLGVAIQEMQHLGQVNALLMALDASPHLIRQDFPYQPDIYPFEFNLEPLTQASLAKYVYTEAPVNGLKRSRVSSPSDHQFLDQLDRVLGGSTRPNHVGSLYDRIIQTLQEYISTTPKRSGEMKPWLAKLEEIKREGEDNHFLFFKRLFLGTHEGFKGHQNIWSLAPNDPAYPSLPLAINPSAFVGHPNQIKDPLALSLAWLGNLHYWTILLLTDAAYSDADHTYIDLAKQQMMGPFLSLARHMPTLGVGMPCEPLSTGYAPCRTTAARLRFVSSMVGESNQLAQQLKDRLPADYPLAVGESMMSTLTEKRAQYA
ncbi:ferritin-like domain-containing protein [Hydrogenophaga sp. ZJX-1]|uniref:ferritin-like domain-containing protein n=1 Tax=Hydrogenophaga sp. ZJX-1 TaxID=3404778 RepID=UPI003B2833A9